MKEVSMRPDTKAIDQRHFRDVLGQFATGIVIVSTTDTAGRFHGMVVGSFGSVSLHPPLVSFMPATNSTTFPKIKTAGKFCVSVMSADQEELCRRFTSATGDKFAGIDCQIAPSGCPIIPDALAWIDCEITTIHEAGDHSIVIGAVNQLQSNNGDLPLIFFRGGFGGFAPPSLLAAPERDLTEPLRLAGKARETLEHLAFDVDLEAHVSARVGNDYVLLGLATPPNGVETNSRVGYRAPLAYPIGAALVAWDNERVQSTWCQSNLGTEAQARSALSRVRDRRWSLALGGESYDAFESTLGRFARDGVPPDWRAASDQLFADLRTTDFEPAIDPAGTYDVRLLSAPVHDATGRGVLCIGLRGFDGKLTGGEILETADRLVSAAQRLSAEIGRSVPNHARTDEPPTASDA